MKKLPLILLSSILIVLAVVIVFKGNADENTNQVCLFSAVSGTVTLHGKPLSHIKITRNANYWNKDNHTDEAMTDADGRFHFEPMMTNSRHIKRSMNPIIFEKLILHHDGKDYVGWDTTRYDIQPNIELDENTPIPVLRCELSNESTIKDVKYGTVNGICTWK